MQTFSICVNAKLQMTFMRNLAGATSFVTFILSTNGENILERQGLNFIKPVIEGNLEKVPSAIRDILEQKEPIQQNVTTTH